MDDAARAIRQVLQEGLATLRPGPLCVGFSGGPDSTALLHALAPLAGEAGRELRALHVDHALDPASADWARHCAAFCNRLGVDLDSRRINVAPAGDGLEAAARRARYAAFDEMLAPGDVLVLAHHRDDQVETVLLKLLRGAGPMGLAGMREVRARGTSWLWRPLLGVSRATLRDSLRQHGLSFIEDPGNRDAHRARNYLRRIVLPQLHRHWPGAGHAIATGAALSRDACGFLQAQTALALARVQGIDPATLHAARWRALPAALRAPALELWLRTLKLEMPTQAQRRELERQVDEAARDSVPRVAWGRTEICHWRGLLYAIRKPPAHLRAWHLDWHGESVDLPDGGRLTLEPAAGSTGGTVRFSEPLNLRLRRGGERLQPVGDAHTRDVRDLFQRIGLPPWQRRTCPYLYAQDGELLAIADLYWSARAQSIFAALAAYPRWRPAESSRH